MSQQFTAVRHCGAHQASQIGPTTHSIQRTVNKRILEETVILNNQIIDEYNYNIAKCQVEILLLKKDTEVAY